MVPSAQYPRSRHVAMQVVLVVVLVATIALAQWVSARHQISLENGQTFSLGSFTLKLPAGWQIGRSQTADLVRITAAEAVEPGRRLTVLYQVLNEPVTPMDYLLHTGLIAGSWNGAQMTLDGHPGVYIEMVRIVAGGGRRMLINDVLFCVVLPNRQVLTVQLTSPGQPDEADQQLMQSLLSDIQIKPESSPSTQPSENQWEDI